MEVTTESSPDGTLEQFSVTNLSFKMAYGRRLTDRLRVGGAVKYIREDIFTAYMQSFVFDLGSNFDTGIYGIVLGMSVSNFGPEVQFHGEGLEVVVADTTARDGKLSRITQKFSVPLIFRLGLEKGSISWAIDRKIDMDVTVPDQTDQAILAEQALRELRALEKQLFGR